MGDTGKQRDEGRKEVGCRSLATGYLTTRLPLGGEKGNKTGKKEERRGTIGGRDSRSIDRWAKEYTGGRRKRNNE